jgi:two-component system chemotaxis response regulator CheY
MKILVVDDSKAMRLIVTRTLRQAGYDCEVVEADNGLGGLAAVGEHAPDLVLSDWNMPECSGIDFLRRLRGSGSAVPFGFVTSEGTDEMRAEAAGAGAQFLVAKPFTPEQLGAAIAEHAGALR